jgi:hypothetical protein
MVLHRPIELAALTGQVALLYQKSVSLGSLGRPARKPFNSQCLFLT